MSDKFVGTLSFFRVFSGRLSVEQPIISQKTGKGHKAGGLMIMQGKQSVTVPRRTGPGDIVAVAKAEDLHIGDTISRSSIDAPKMHTFKYPVSMFGLAVEPKTRGDEGRRSPAASTRSRRRTPPPSTSAVTPRRRRWSSPA